MTSADSVLRIIISTTMRPFVRLLLRFGVSFGDLSKILRKLYVEVAADEFKIPDRKQSIARVAVLTGLTRRDVKNVMSEPRSEFSEFKFNRAIWALSGWQRDKKFLDKNGQPRALSVESVGAISFQGLVKKYCGDVPYRSILDELLHKGAVQIVEKGLVFPTSTGYVPTSDSLELLEVSFQSVADHISTIDYNSQHRADDSRLQLTVHYDNVTEEGMEIFRQLSRDKSKELLLYLDRFLASQDRDTNTNIEGTGSVRTGISIFYFEDTNSSKEEGGE